MTDLGTYPLNNIPEKSLVGEGQFIRIDSKYNFINSYKYYTQYKIAFHSEGKLGEVKYINDKPYIDTCNNNRIPVTGINDSVSEGQIVLADAAGRIKIFFKRMHFVLDYFYEIIKYKGIEVWRIINIIDNLLII